MKRLIKDTVEALSVQMVKSFRLLRSVPELQPSRNPLKDEIAARQMILTEVHDQIAALKSRQNELLPIHRLPMEVLSIVLSIALSLNSYHKERTKLLLVCRTWANLIDGNRSTFWTTLSVGDPRRLRARLLRKSDGMPVTVVITGSPHGSYEATNDFVKYIRSNDVPFRELVIRERGDDVMEAVFANCFAAPAPHLRSLDIKVEHGWVLEGDDPKLQHLRMFSGVAPNLKSVRLFGVCIPWNSAILRGLLSFSLEYPDYCGARTSLAHVLGILQDCSALQSLTLIWHETFDHSTFQSAVVLPRPSLDQLKTLNLSTSSFQSNLSLLRHIQFPRTATVAIEKKYFNQQDDDDEVLNATLSLLQQHLSIKSLQSWNLALGEVVQPVEDIGQPTWVCPKLASLEITVDGPNSLDLAAIIKLARMRNSDVQPNEKQIIKSPITSIRVALESGRLSSGQADLLNELKSEVADVQCVIPPETDEAQSKCDTESDLKSPLDASSDHSDSGQ
ncbi:hypothetical protein FRC04_001768 [Tulasnella sp. 424]|nr:hypothetical protein FRC04_001768 [Tulasnella sp. 424]KAG8968163.1 hypothetical protein FRC05_001640 [Tulasnella sp. 425]